MSIREGLTYDDVLLVPQYNDRVDHRDIDVDLTVELRNHDDKIWRFMHPIVPANMLSIASPRLLYAAGSRGGLGVAHRFDAFSEQLSFFQGIQKSDASKWRQDVLGASIGVQEDDERNVEDLYQAGVRIYVVDIAHGHSKACIRQVKYLSGTYKDILIIAGNVATASGAKRLWDAGADVVKVGVGPGSLCTTRVETGNGVPQLTAIMDVAEARKSYTYPHKHGIIADGGLMSAGSIVKALCFSDMVMSGNLFAGCEEAPGRIIEVDGRQYKEYVGSSTHRTGHIEGVEAMVPVKGSFNSILDKLLDGVHSGCSYQNSRNLQELQEAPEFIRVTAAGIRESNHHDVLVRG